MIPFIRAAERRASLIRWYPDNMVHCSRQEPSAEQSQVVS
jgi:hypothetical protein